MKTVFIWCGVFTLLIGTLIYLVSVRNGYVPSLTKDSVEVVATTTALITFDQAAVHTCEDGSVIAIAYKTADKSVLELSLPSINPIQMNQTEAVESTVFKNETGYELSFSVDKIQIKKDGESMYSNCALGTTKIIEPVTTSSNNLQATKWKWVETILASSTSIKPSNPDDFIITFLPENRFSANTDCNNIGGAYSTGPFEVLMFTDIISTRMACVGDTKEAIFTTHLEQVSLYQIINNDLIMTLTSMDNSGQMTFVKY